MIREVKGSFLTFHFFGTCWLGNQLWQFWQRHPELLISLAFGTFTFDLAVVWSCCEELFTSVWTMYYGKTTVLLHCVVLVVCLEIPSRFSSHVCFPDLGVGSRSSPSPAEKPCPATPWWVAIHVETWPISKMTFFFSKTGIAVCEVCEPVVGERP